MLAPFFISSKPDSLLHFMPIGGPCTHTFKGLSFILVVKGSGLVEIDNVKYVLHPKSLISLLPSHLVNTISKTENFQCLSLSFSFDFMSDFPYSLHSNISSQMERKPAIKLSVSEFEKIKKWHKALMQHYPLTTHPQYVEILRAMTYIFTADVCASYSNEPINKFSHISKEITDKFFRLLHEHFKTDRRSAFYANRLCITPKYLSKIIQQVTDHAPSYWIADFNVREAKMLLQSTSLTVTQISEKLNFPNSSFFARYFKRHAGVAPKEFQSN